MIAAYTLEVVVIVFPFNCIGFVIVEQQAQRLRSSPARDLDDLVRDNSVTALQFSATQQYHKGRQYFALLVFDGTAVKPYACQTMLTTGVRASTDLDLNIIVIDKIWIFFFNNALKFNRDLCAIRYAE